MDHLSTHPFPYFGILATRDVAAIKAAVEAKVRAVGGSPECVKNAKLLSKSLFGKPRHFDPDMEKVEAILAKCLPEFEAFAIKQVEADGKTLLPAKFEACVEYGEKSLGLAPGVARFHLEKFMKARGIGVGARGSVRDNPQTRHTAHPFPYLGIPATRDLAAISKALEAKFREVAPFENDPAKQDEFLSFMRNATIIAKHCPELAGRFKPEIDRVDAVLRRAMQPIEAFVMEHAENNAIHPKELERCIESVRKQFGVAASVSRPHLEEFLERKRIAVTSRAVAGDAPPIVVGVPLEDENAFEDVESRAAPRRSVIRRPVEVKQPLRKWIFAAVAGVVLLSAGGGAVLYAVFFNKKTDTTIAKEEPPLEKPGQVKPGPAPVLAPPDSKDRAGNGVAAAVDGFGNAPVRPKPGPRSPFPTRFFFPGAKWGVQKSQDGVYAAHFPGMPGMMPGPYFGRTSQSYSLDSANEAVHVSVLTGLLDPQMPAANRQMLLDSLLGPPQSMFGIGPMVGPGVSPMFKEPMPGPGMAMPQKVSEKDVKWLGQDVKEVVLEWPMPGNVKNLVVGRGLIKGDRLVVVRIAGAGGRPPPEYEKEFFEKFELLK